MVAFTDVFENKIVDWAFRAQAYTVPGTLYVALYTVTPSDAGGGTEVSASGYGRQSVISSLANWAGTQSAASTTASTGSGGTTSNNNAVTFGSPTANWGSIVAFGILDATTAGNLLVYGALTTGKTVNNGDAAPSFAAAALSIQIDT